MTSPALPFERIYVDAGSHAATLSILRDLQPTAPRGRVLDGAVLVGVFLLGLLCLLPSWASANPAAARTTPNA